MPWNAEDTCPCEVCTEYRATKKRDTQSSAQELTEQGRDVLGYHRVINKMIKLKLTEPQEDHVIAVLHELMHVTDSDKAIIGREIVTSAKKEKPQFSNIWDALLSAFTESLEEASKAS